MGTFSSGEILYMYPNTQGIETDTTVYKNLALKIASVTSLDYSLKSESPITLEKPKPNSHKTTLSFLSNESFNFMENSGMILEPSPPQIMYLGETDKGTTLLEEFCIDNNINSSGDIGKFIGFK